MNQAIVEDVVAEVMRRLGGNSALKQGGGVRAAEAPMWHGESAPLHRPNLPDGEYGIFSRVDDAVSAAAEAHKKLVRLSMDDRDAIVKLIKSTARQHAKAWGEIELQETKIGRLDHKIEKLQILELVPGVEFLRTGATSGSNGVCLEDYAPFGVIGIITPVTHSVPTLSANAINMIASGNSIVANPHPSGTTCAAIAVREYNRLIAAKYGIEHLITCIVPPTLETAEAIFKHHGIPLLVVTGGPAVARAALAAKKRAIVAGPGNPPVIVDETACLVNAANSIVKGGAYDNNLLCIGEKEVFCVSSVFNDLMNQMTQSGGYVLNSRQIDDLTKAAFTRGDDGKPHVNKQFVGKDAAVLARSIGLDVPPTTQLLVGETDAEHAFVQEEQMMPFIPFVRVRDVKEAMDRALQAEHGFRHTALMHSRDMERVTRFGKMANTTLYVINGPSMAGLGLGGQGYLSYSIATPTGEGITTPLTFTRYRRTMVTGAMRMI